MTYVLKQEDDGLIYIYRHGVRHSRFGVKPPANEDERKVLEAVPALLNKEKMPEPLMLAAYSLYLHHLW